MSNDRAIRSSRSGYLPTLDGWRAIAVFAVIFYHDKLHRFWGISDAPVHSMGNLGVDLFFAISGLLICSRLLEEEKIFHGIRLGGFYIRRFCRILPPAFLYLAVVGALGLRHILRVNFGAWLSSLLFVNNYYSAHMRDSSLSLSTNHFWSLAVEEHFYLILPAILVFFPRNRIRILGALSAVALVYSVGIHAFPRVLRSMGGDYAEVRTEMHIVSLLFPALLAILLVKTDFRALCERWLAPWATLFAVAALGACVYRISHGLFLKAFVPLSFPFLILSTVLHPGALTARLLEHPAFKFLGRISYSIYLWQQMFFIGDQPAAPGILGWLQRWPITLLATMLCAVASYYLVERPFIHLGHRLAPPATRGRPV